LKKLNNMETSVDVWEEVLLKLGYKFSEERCGN